MDRLRQRVPFKFSEADQQTIAFDILDEQEQDEVIRDLRIRNSTSTRQYNMAAFVILALSSLLHFVFLVNPSKTSPLIHLSPSRVADPDPPLPLISLFTVISLAIHLNLVFLLDPRRAKILFGDDVGEQIVTHCIPYQLCYAIAAVAPTLCLFLGRTWQTIAWWCFPMVLVYITQSLQQAIAKGNEGISVLEAMKYSSPGA